jgi:hypothetical protein
MAQKLAVLCAILVGARAMRLPTRRRVVLGGGAAAAAAAAAVPARAAELPTGGRDLFDLVAAARRQLDDVPALIEAGKWDSVRAILIQPPIADVWGKNAKPLLKRYAEAVGNADGDELAVLEARRAASRHAAFAERATRAGARGRRLPPAVPRHGARAAPALPRVRASSCPAQAVYNNVFSPVGGDMKVNAKPELVKQYYEMPMQEFRASAKALDALVKLGSGLKY